MMDSPLLKIAVTKWLEKSIEIEKVGLEGPISIIVPGAHHSSLLFLVEFVNSLSLPDLTIEELSDAILRSYIRFLCEIVIREPWVVDSLNALEAFLLEYRPDLVPVISRTVFHDDYLASDPTNSPSLGIIPFQRKRGLQ